MTNSISGASARSLEWAVWSALNGDDSHLGVGGDLAKRYRPEVGPFAGVADDRDPAAWAALAELVGTGLETSVVAVVGQEPPSSGWREVRTLPCSQMACTPSDPPGPDDDEPEFIRLGQDDVDDMLELTTLTEPGPFGRATYRFGGYRGLRIDGELVCMAGERLHPDGWTEISAVCTRPGFTGRGYGAALVRSLVRDIAAAGRGSFLHVMDHNTRARDLYVRLGFETFRDLTIRVITPQR